MFNLQTITSSALAKQVGPKAGIAVLAAKKGAPEAMLVGGIVSGIISGIMLARAYKKHEEIITPVVEDLSYALEIVEQNENSLLEERTAEEHDLARETISEVKTSIPKIYAEIVGRGIRLYGPSVLMGGMSIYMLLTSHGIMRGRNAAAIAAFSLMEKGFNQYRKRVVEEQGADADERYYFGADERVTSIETVDSETGKKIKTKSKAPSIPETPDPKQIYTRVFDEINNRYFSEDRDWNLMFLRAKERQANDKYNLQGFLMLNTVLEWLGYEETWYGALVGWSKKAEGDDFVDFGLSRAINMNDGDNRFILDFNVNGSVWGYI